MYIKLDDETYFDEMLMDTLDVLARVGVNPNDINHVSTMSLSKTYAPLYPKILFSHMVSSYDDMSKAMIVALSMCENVQDAASYFTQPCFKGLLDTDELEYQKNNLYK